MKEQLGRIEYSPGRGDRARRADRGRRQPLRRERALAARGAADAILTVSPQAEAEQIERLKAWRSARDEKAVEAALDELRAAAQQDRNIMPASIACAKAGVTTGEWGAALRETSANTARRPGSAAPCATTTPASTTLRAEVERVSRKLGRRLKFLVGKPGLDGHSNGAEQIAVRARDAGMEVIYHGIRLTPGGDRRGGARRRARTSWACRSCRARMCRWSRTWSRACRRRARRRPVRGRRHHSAGGRLRAQASRALPRSIRRRTSR